MTHIYNDPRGFKEDMIEGFVRAHRDRVRRVPNASAVMSSRAPVKGKVALIIGGGSGHYPAFCGLVGEGLADAAVIGDIFTSPSAEQVYRCTKAVEGGAGVVYSFGNYSGDVMHFGLAEMRCESEGIDVRTVLVTDDVASAPPEQRADRRGIAGDLYVFKVAGASAHRGDPLDEVERLARKANDHTRTIGVAFGGCTLPGKSEPLFRVDPGRMEFGLGIHGEPGVSTSELLPAPELARLLVGKLLEEAPPDADGTVALMLNGLGSTKYEELFVLYRYVSELVERAGLRIHHPLVGEYVTSLDMAGCSLTCLWLDEELRELHDAPARTPAMIWEVRR